MKPSLIVGIWSHKKINILDEIKFCAQLSISITIFQVFGMTRLWLELATSRSGSEHSTFTLPVGTYTACPE